MDTPLLQLNRVVKSFGAVRALKEVSFSVQAGEVHALLGENGAGKSTLIKIITGAYQPDSGTIEMNGATVSALTPAASHKLGIACIYQQPALFPELSVAENIALRLERSVGFRRVNWGQRRTAAKALLERVGARIAPDAEVRSLSMPEQQLVEIACALGTGARVVIMDEPTASLTQKEQHLLFSIVRDLRTKGVAIIYISHRLEEIFALADRVTVLRDGETVGTHLVDQTTEASLIRFMVGREVSALYPQSAGRPAEPILALKGLGCSGAGVRGIDLELRAGEILGLAGLVGAGRTELARVLFGITPADSGQILLRGQEIQIASPQAAIAHGIAYVPEDRRRHGVILEMSVASNITMAIHQRLFPMAWLRFPAEQDLARESMQNLAIKAFGPEAPVASLSGGNQQKVSLSRWLATKPRVLILDEPTQGVDVGAKAEIHKIIRQLADEGLGVLMISSDLPEVLGMSDRIAVMRNGSIANIFEGKTADPHSVMAAALGQKDVAA
ncbi:MAG TPA: sugar ABC transporter ATP-binding protein [Candidatus Saccharimonadales bacterium]|nr:sugar ABC transporter ATP-binding protein [Candidatus Saccharimonadales bacterium]